MMGAVYHLVGALTFPTLPPVGVARNPARNQRFAVWREDDAYSL
jgi:hypothetical protein